jgi:hypothetical protein
MVIEWLDEFQQLTTALLSSLYTGSTASAATMVCD